LIKIIICYKNTQFVADYQLLNKNTLKRIFLQLHDESIKKNVVLCVTQSEKQVI